MWTLDASIVARSFDSADAHQEVCLKLLEYLDQQTVPMVVPRLLLTEIAGAVRRITRDPMRARLAAEAWTRLPHVQLVTLDDALIDEAAEIAADRALKGADAVYVAVARRSSPQGYPGDARPRAARARGGPRCSDDAN